MSNLDSKNYFEKDIKAILDYDADWTTWLGTDTIVTGTWTVPAGLTKVTETNTTKVSTVWVSGGTEGTTYTLENFINTSGGRSDNRKVFIIGVDK